jgi:acyl transferase domain-containing protein
MCHRIRALQSLNQDPAGMLAVFCAENRVRSAISDLGPCSLQVSVVNHDEQTVVSGTWADLQRLEQWIERLGIQFTRLKSRYPFHSALLRPAVDQFEVSLRTLKFSPPSIPVYSPIERGFYSAKSDITGLLASHLVRPFTFPEALRRLYQLGGRVFIECGGGDILSKVVRRTLADQEGLKVHSPLATGRGAEDGLRKIIVEYTTGVPLSQPAEAKSSGIASSETDGAGKATDVPVAIVSMGCVVPGANGPGEFWRNILEGRSGIFDASELRPDMALDFLSKGEVVPDKTYTLLGGFIRNLNPHMSKLPYSDREFTRLSSAQRFLAVAMSQCLSGLNGLLPKSHLSSF